MWDRDAFWGKSGVTLASDEQGVCYLEEIVGTPTSVEYIWSGLGSVKIDHGARAGAAVAGREY